MNYYLKSALFLAIFIGVGCWYLTGKESLYMLPRITSVHEVRALFPTTPDALRAQVNAAIEKAQKGIDVLVALKPEERTFENTIQALDTIGTNLGIVAHIAWTMQNVHPDEAMRVAAQEAMINIQNFSVDNISYNPKVYAAVKEYAEKSAELLNAEEAKYLDETLEDFEKSGLNLPLEEQEVIKQLKKDLAQASITFSGNINSDLRSIAVPREALAGLDDDFIASLKQNEQGDYILGTDYPTYHAVIENCSVESTRHALWKAFNNRAYPANEPVLKNIIALRDRLAKKLSFTSYAELDLDDQMVETPEHAHEFLESLIARSKEKSVQETALLKKHLPAGVALTKQGLFKPWDLRYVSSQYKKKYLALDDEKLKEYFPVQKTIDELLSIYEQFLSIEFKQEPLTGLWHPDARYVAVYTKKDAAGKQTLLGHLILDLHPRPNKYGHACMSDLVPAVREKNGTYHPPVILVIANFPKPTAAQPGLLRYNDVTTFFHEFGHAMHGLFGATQMAGYSGTNVATDFVEMPSQMLEEWMYDPAILKKMSAHYKTGEPLDDATIAKIREVKQFGTGFFVQRQSALALLSLACFAAGEQKDPTHLRKEIFGRLFKDDIMQDPDDHFEASFGHLSGYGAKYYSYLWSKVFALDMFEHIQKFGLLNPEIGKHYIDTVISKGGSVEPEEILVNFLGREPNMDAFLKDLGL